MTTSGWVSMALVAAVALIALAVALACAARIRELQERLDIGMSGPATDLLLPAVGAPVPDFAAVTTDGAEVDASDLAGPDTPVLFLTTDCDACSELIRRVTGPAPGPLDGFRRPLAVLIGPPGERAAVAADLARVTRVLEDDNVGGLAARFGVRAFPAVLVAGDGVVRAAVHELDEIPRPRRHATA